MCDRIGCTHFPNLTNVDLSGASASRRKFLKGAVATTAITMAAGPGMMMGGAAHAAAGIKSTHGSGFCNLNIFLAHSRQYAKSAGVELEFINTPTSAAL